jgi:hypothetical protein
LGYNDKYDTAFKTAEDVAYYVKELNVSSVTFKSTFNYKSVHYGDIREWRIQAWKGNYAQLGAGAVGVFILIATFLNPHLIPRFMIK